MRSSRLLPRLGLLLLRHECAELRLFGSESARAAPALRVFSVHAVLDAALRRSARFCVDFDRARLIHSLGNETLRELLPHLAQRHAPGPLERQEEPLDEARKQLLRRVLSFEREQWDEPPVNYIERVVLFDTRGQIVLRASDSLDSILFLLPDGERRQLIERLSLAGVPNGVIQSLPLDIADGLD